MTAYLRMVILLARPSAIAIFGLFAATGLAQAGVSNDRGLLVHVLVVVIAFTLFCVIVNDLTDRAIDEVNLAGDRRRPLVTGSAVARDFVVIAATAGGVALSGALLLSWSAAIVTAVGMVFSAAYSLRPVRIADRGAMAALLLPMGYVAVPYLIGIFSVRNHVGLDDILLGAALYAGFIGRILLKDFRDVRGDSLFGKRTFLVRHGRRWTCAFAAACWLAGTATLATVRGCTPSLVLAYAGHVCLALALLHALSYDRGARRDERLISAVAIVGRSIVVTLLAHLAMNSARWPATRAGAVTVALVVLASGQAWLMVRYGPAAPRSRRWQLPATSDSDARRSELVGRELVLGRETA